MKNFKDRVVVITGASRGIGKETALEFARLGACVVLGSRDIDRLKALSQKIESMGHEVMIVPCDVSKEDDCHALIRKTIERFGRIDVLINNAGVGCYAAVTNLSTQALDAIFRTNLYGSIWCAQAAIPHMKKRGEGHIVNVSTIISRRSIPFSSAYCMTKFAMNAFDESLRLEVRPWNIDVSLICPGLTATDFQENASNIESTKPPFMSQGGMDPAVVARAIVRAVRYRRRRVGLTLSGRFLWAFQKLSPTFVDEIVFRIFLKRHPLEQQQP